MSGERRFAAVNTKIRVLKSKLLSEKDYMALMEMTSLSEQVDYLRKYTIYIDELKDISGIEDIQEVEWELENHVINQFNKITKFFTDEYKKLFDILLLRYEIEDLKHYLRVLERKEDIDKDKRQRISKKLSRFDVIVKEASNLNEFIEKLKGTIYYKVLNPYKDEDETRIMFYMEMNLDKMYFNLLKSVSDNLSKEDKESFQEFLGRNIDLLNIEWIYRGIKFYNLLPEELINYTLPNGYEFNYERLKKMSYSSLDELKDIVEMTRYNFLLEGQDDIDLYLDRKVQRYLRNESLDYFKKAKLNISLSIGYLHLLEFEVRDIISILESTQYGLTAEQTKPYLIRKIEGSDNR